VQKCPSCQATNVAGSLFCESCGETLSQVQVARKLRQTSFDTIKDAGPGLLAPGERIKAKYSYLIEEAIARSGFGATFRAQRKDNEKPVLIKQMLDQASYDQFKNQLLKAFKREAKFLRKIKHPAFPRGFEYFERNNSFYLVMEFINGKELSKAIDDYKKQNKGTVEDGLVIYLGREIADALEIIHQQGFIYRDLKPQNVMLDGISSRVKLIDFGTLYHISDRDPLLFESEGYTPPDLLKKDSKFTPAGDIYSLGALLYEIIMGETPKLGELGLLDTMGVDPRLVEIIKKCLDPDPLKRYQKARTVRDELNKLTKKGIWPFRNSKTIEAVELSVLPKTLYPASCTFCDYCGFSDPQSQLGYCKKCRVPLKVGRIQLLDEKKPKEFFLYSDETLIGSSSQSHFKLENKAQITHQHARIFRRKTALWLEAVSKDAEDTLLNRRKILGPIELVDGDTIELPGCIIKFSIKDAC